MRLANKTAIVTGGASGFGAGIVKKFVAEGARVIIADINGDAAHAMAAELSVDGVPGTGERGSDGGRDISDAMVRGTHADRGAERRTCGVDEMLVARVSGLPDDEGDRTVGDPPIDGCREVEAEQVPIAQGVVVRQPMQDRVVHGRADHLAEGAPTEGGSVVDVAGAGVAAADEVASPGVDVEEVDSRLDAVPQLLEHVGDKAPGGTHLVDLTR